MMKKIVAAVSMTGIAIGLVLLNPEKFGICSDVYFANGYTGCLDELKNEIGGIIEIFSIALFIVFLPLSFFSDKVFNAWFKFARVYLPVSLFLVFISSPYDTGALGTPSGGAWLMFFSLVIFVITSIAIVLYNYGKGSLLIQKNSATRKNVKKK
jgi:hypothetical protein